MLVLYIYILKYFRKFWIWLFVLYIFHRVEIRLVIRPVQWSIFLPFEHVEAGNKFTK